MHKSKIYFILVLALALIVTACKYKDDTYEVGQIWSYHTREGEENSTLQILAIENSDSLGVIISICIEGLEMPYGNFNINRIKHLPLAKTSIDSSVINLVGKSTDIPEYKEAYNAWKKAMKNGECTILYGQVKDVVHKAEKAFNGE